MPVAWLLGEKHHRLGPRGGQLFALIGAGLGVFAGLSVLLGGESLDFNNPWPMPFGAIHLKLDPLAELFLVLVLGLSAVLVAFTGRRSTTASKGGSTC